MDCPRSLVIGLILIFLNLSYILSDDETYDCRRANEIKRKLKRLQELRDRMFDLQLQQSVESAQDECVVCGCKFGPKGERGIPGDEGPPGDKGEMGPPGQKGSQGYTCTPGPPQMAPPIRGDNGESGEVGDPGDKGDKVSCMCEENVWPCHLCQRDPRGPPGHPGEDGIPGIPGPKGKKGQPGGP